MGTANTIQVMICPKCKRPKLFFYNNENNHPHKTDDITQTSCAHCGYEIKVIKIINE